MKNAHQTDGERVSMLETVKQCLEHSRHPPYREPATMNERFSEVDHFLRLLDNWGYAVVSKHSLPPQHPPAQARDGERT